MMKPAPDDDGQVCACSWQRPACVRRTKQAEGNSGRSELLGGRMLMERIAQARSELCLVTCLIRAMSARISGSTTRLQFNSG